MRVAALALCVLVLVGGCASDDRPEVRQVPTMALRSPAFGMREELPRRFTCDGEGISPPLRWEGVPEEAVELALEVVDRDAPGRTVVWTVWGIPATRTSLDEGRLPEDAEEGATSGGGTGWAPPCPPPGDPPHRYDFELTAVSAPLGLEPGAAPDRVRAAIEEFALAGGLLAARYGR